MIIYLTFVEENSTANTALIMVSFPCENKGCHWDLQILWGFMFGFFCCCLFLFRFFN